MRNLVYCFYDLLSKSKHHNLNGWGFPPSFAGSFGTSYFQKYERPGAAYLDGPGKNRSRCPGRLHRQRYLPACKLSMFPSTIKGISLKDKIKYYLIPFDGQEKEI